MEWPRIQLQPHSKDFGAPLGSVNPANPLAFVDLAIDGEPAGRLMLEVKVDNVPAAGRLMQLWESGDDKIFVGSALQLQGEDGARLSSAEVLPGGVVEDESSPLAPWARGAVALSSAAGGAGGHRLEIFLEAAVGVHPGVVLAQVIKGYRLLDVMHRHLELAAQPLVQMIDSGILRPSRISANRISTPAPRKQAGDVLTFLHFNDVYEIEARVREPVGGASRFVELINSYADAAVFFSGDVFAPSLMSTVTKGKHMVPFLNMMGIKAACIGNHDFDCPARLGRLSEPFEFYIVNRFRMAIYYGRAAASKPVLTLLGPGSWCGESRAAYGGVQIPLAALQRQGQGLWRATGQCPPVTGADTRWEEAGTDGAD
jgi:hypothetical protein